MLILQAGVEKSGNYWLYSILQNILLLKEQKIKSYIQEHPIFQEAKTWNLSTKNQARIDVIDFDKNGIYFRISSRFRQKVEDVDLYLSKCTHVWTHSAFLEKQIDIYKKFDKIIYLIRDPRDVLISLSKFVFSIYMKKYYPTKMQNYYEFLESRIGSHPLYWNKHTLGYLSALKILKLQIVFYEQLLMNFESEVDKISNFLGFTLSKSEIEMIKINNSFTKMREENPGHIREGKIFNWKNEFTTEQQKRINRIIGPTLDLFNYPIKNEQESLPKVPNLEKVALKDLNHFYLKLNRTREYIKSQLKRIYYYTKNKLRRFFIKLNKKR